MDDELKPALPKVVPETPEKYKQLVSEIRKQKKELTHKHIQYKLCSILEIMMQSKQKGMSGYLRG